MKSLLLLICVISSLHANKLLNLVRKLNDQQLEEYSDEHIEGDTQTGQVNDSESNPENQDSVPKRDYDDNIFDLGPLSAAPEDDGQSKILYISSFDKLMRIGMTVNHYYNNAIGLVHEQVEDDGSEHIDEELKQYEDTKELLIETTVQKNSLAEEVDKFYSRIDDTKMTSDEALKFFGFYDRYKVVMNGVSTRTPEYKEISDQLESLVEDYNNKMKGFFKGIYNLRHLEGYLYNMAAPYKDEYLGSLTDTEKIKLGEEMADILTGFGENLYSQFENIETGLEINDTIRANLFNVVGELTKLMPDENEMLNAAKNVKINASFIFILMSWLIYY